MSGSTSDKQTESNDKQDQVVDQSTCEHLEICNDDHYCLECDKDMTEYLIDRAEAIMEDR